MDLASILSACTVPPIEEFCPTPLTVVARAQAERSRERAQGLKILMLIASHEPLERRAGILSLND